MFSIRLIPHSNTVVCPSPFTALFITAGRTTHGSSNSDTCTVCTFQTYLNSFRRSMLVVSSTWWHGLRNILLLRPHQSGSCRGALRRSTGGGLVFTSGDTGVPVCAQGAARFGWPGVRSRKRGSGVRLRSLCVRSLSAAWSMIYVSTSSLPY